MTLFIFAPLRFEPILLAELEAAQAQQVGKRFVEGAFVRVQSTAGKNAPVRFVLSGMGVWKRLELDGFFEQALDREEADVAWSRVAALLAINRLCGPGSGLAIEQPWYPATRWTIC